MLRNRLLTDLLFSKLFRAFHALFLLISAFWLAWIVLAQFNFAYPTNYQLLEIDKHIQTYAPQNRYRHGFETTDKATQLKLFSETCDAIRHNPSSLKSIEYKHGENVSTLLHEDEVIHLTDVSNIVRPWETIGLVITIISALIVSIGIANRQKLPSIRSISAIILTITIIGALVYFIDPDGVFAWLHEVVFPDDHPWFFYYQDSLMTTLMKAPDLFFVIAIEWAVLAILILAIYLIATTRNIRS